MKYAIAIDLGATNMRVALGNEKGKILVKLKERTVQKGDKHSVACQMLRMIASITEKHTVSIAGVGIASLGPLDLKKKAIVHPANLSYNIIDLKPLKKTGRKIFLLHETSAAVLGEKTFGAGKKLVNVVYVTLSSGIGTGAIVDGNLLSGIDGNAGELGHMNIDTHYNFLCSCKKGRGHWEAYASGKNMGRFFKHWLKENNINKPSFKAESKTIFNAAKNGNKTALKFLNDVGKLNAKALSNIIVAYSPELITLGGSEALYHSKLILEPIKKYVDTFLKKPKIMITPLGEDVVLLGVLAAVFSQKGSRL
ncbi:hypothetical protein COV18_05520 [Candidatus Woesearchaeota archaeon CG10_big_fil_rev_8_21_14_0_10_37_12]|nr:MAG: hypothetical protein COV18_05520 [Candidatus Woesearchaeota archaeon CG10_big_fil_rev_8_21_14_0_10_37_12]